MQNRIPQEPNEETDAQEVPDWPCSVRELEKLARAYPPLTREEQSRLAALAKWGSPRERALATELLFKHNARRLLYFIQLYAKDAPATDKKVLSSKRKYMLRWKDSAPHSMDTEAILGAAIAGFWRALRTFDPTRGKFNQHLNVSIWRSIQDARQKEERYERLLDDISTDDMVIGDADAVDANTDVTLLDLHRNTEKEIARIMFDHYLERYCPKEAKRVRAILDERIPPDNKFLAEVGRRLEQALPPEEWAWLKEQLTG